MGTFVAFLRGMNLGGRRITNDELCACFEQFGFVDASAFLASGNVIFGADADDEPALRARIEGGLREQLDYAVPTFLRRADELARIAAEHPFTAEELATTEGRVQVGLLHAAPPDAAHAAVAALSSAEDRLVLDGRELWWLPRAGISTSDLDLTAVGGKLGGTTVRTHRTLRRLHDRLSH